MSRINRRKIRGLRSVRDQGSWRGVHHSTKAALIESGWVEEVELAFNPEDNGTPSLTRPGKDVLEAFDLGAGHRR